VIKEEPALDDVPERVRPLLRRCLRKDPRERLRDIGDAWALLDAGDAHSSSERAAAATATARRERLVLRSALAIVALVAVGAVAWSVRSGHAVPAAPVRFEIPPPVGATLLRGALPAISPDGRVLAFPAAGADGVYRIWLRALDTLDARPLAGTEGPGPSLLVWSPDSRHLAFSTAAQGGGGRASSGQGGLVRRIDVSGGLPQTVCEVPAPAIAVGGAWNRDGAIILGNNVGGLMRASTGGGPCSPLTTSGPDAPEQHLFPVFLPDGRHFLYIAQDYTLDQDRPAGWYDLYVGSLDARPEDQKIKKLLTTDHGVQYVPSDEPGRGTLLFGREGTLFVQAFDPDRFELTSEATPIAQDIGTLYANAYFSASTTGVLVYRTRASNQHQLTSFDRAGRVLGRAGDPIFPRTLALSSDGTRAAFESYHRGLFVVDLVRGTTTRLGDSDGNGLAWSPDGTRMAFSEGLRLSEMPASGAGNPEQLSSAPLSAPELRSPLDWSRDGGFLLYQTSSPVAGSDLFALRLDGDRMPIPVVQTSSSERDGRLSPDGRLIAYTSDKSGRDEVYVRPFVPPSAGAPRDAGEEWTISKGGPNAVFGWQADGRELWYRTADGKVMAVAVSEGPRFGDARLLFQLPPGTLVAATNGDRILAAVPTEASARVPITVVLGWPALVGH
jgi:Tol biopolymer transport system component